MNDIDPLLHDAMARVRGPVDSRPSLTDVRRRARRHNRRRMTATVGVVACTGVATAALIIRRDSAGTSTGSAPAGSVADGDESTTVSFPLGTTTTVFGAQSMTIDASMVWNALEDLSNYPSARGFTFPPADVDRGQMPTAAMFGCDTDACAAMFNYVVWNELGRVLGYFDAHNLQAYNPYIDFAQLPREGEVLQMPGFSGPPPTTALDPNNETPTTPGVFDGVILIDGGAPAGAMEDAYQRLPGYNRTIVPSSGKTVEQTMVMPIGDNIDLVAAVGGVFGIDGFDTWDPSFIGAPIQGMVAVVIGPDYFDRVGGIPVTVDTAATTTTIIG